jgi:L-ascorbate metabolism protein UlaG (beta-lactamase superfamily)
MKIKTRALMLFFFLAAAVFLLWFLLSPRLGSAPGGLLLERISRSPNYQNNKFVNTEKTPIRSEDSPISNTIKEYFNGQNERYPSTVIETVKFNKEKFLSGKGCRISWLGHSTVLINIDGYIILTDPVFSRRPSPVSFIGTKIFKYTETPAVEDMPGIDAVIISHDHYDHLDYESIIKLINKTGLFLVPPGVSSHLIKWGVSPDKIRELDWWEEYSADKDKIFACTPARHFSGRKIIDSNKTLWSSWVININNNKIFFSGDSGYGEHYKKIGEKYGPFILTMLECGQYNNDWRYVHELPDQVLAAHNDLKGHKLLPVHWGKYLLSLHSWKDPMEKLFSYNAEKKKDITVPMIGDIMDINAEFKNNFWWEKSPKR